MSTSRRRIARRMLCGVAWAALLLGPAAARAADTLLIAGSGYTMPPFIETWIAVFNARGGVQVEFEGRGTPTGPPALLSGRAQIASMTRELNAEEREAFQRKLGHEPLAVPVALDAVAIFVHAGNPLQSLTPLQVDALFSADRRCGAESDLQSWGDLGLGAAFAAQPIHLYGRRPGSGTGEFFRRKALCDGHLKTSLRTATGPRSSARSIASDPYGIGFSSRADGVDGTRPLPIATDVGPTTVAAGDVYSAAYPLARRLYFYVDRPFAPGVREFLRFALSPEGQLAVESAGYLSLPRALARQSLRALR